MYQTTKCKNKTNKTPTNEIKYMQKTKPKIHELYITESNAKFKHKKIQKYALPHLNFNQKQQS